MGSMFVMVLFSILNMCSIILYSVVLMIAVDVVFCQPNVKLKRVFPRDICIMLARLKKRLNIDQKYSASMFVMIASMIAIALKISELTEVLDYTNYKVCLRVMASVFISLAFIKTYRALGYKSILLK